MSCPAAPGKGQKQRVQKRDQDAFTGADQRTLQDFSPALGIILETCGRLLSVPAAGVEIDRG